MASNPVRPLHAMWLLLPLFAGVFGLTWLQQQGWALTYGSTGADFATSVQRLNEGGYWLTGYTDSFGAGKQDGWVWRVDDAGSVVWQRAYGGDADDTFTAATKSAADGFVVVGSTRSFNVLGQDAWAVRLDVQGRSLWQNAYGGAGDETANAIWATPDGGYLLVGSSSSGGMGKGDGWMWRLDATGEMVWQIAYGGAAADIFNALVATMDGNYVVAGETWSFGASLGDAWLLKVGPDGTVLWQKRYGGTLADGFQALQPTADGGVVAVGYTDSTGRGGRDAWVLQVDTSGEIIWQRAYGGIGTDQAMGLLRLPDKGFLVAGTTDSFGAGNGDAWLLRLDVEGQVLWQKAYGGDLAADVANGVAAGQAGGAVLAGHTFAFGAGAADAWLLQVGDQGEMVDAGIIFDSEAATTRTSAVAVSTDANGQQVEVASRLLNVRPQTVSSAAATLAPRILNPAATPTSPVPAVAPSSLDSPITPYLSLGFASVLVAWVGFRLWRGRKKRV